MLHYIPADELLEESLNRMSGTPHSLGLEVDEPVVVESDEIEEVKEVKDEDSVTMTPVVEEEEYIDVMDMVDEDCVDEDLFSDF